MGIENETTEWSAVNKIIRTAKPWFEEQRKALDGILRESNDRLSPLCDPLTVDLGSHRWLREERETAYSDWLAWVIQQLPSTESLFFLFDILPTENLSRTAEIGTDREVPIQTRSGKTRYLDVLVSCSKKPQLVIEIKKRNAEDEEQKLEDYCEWADNHDVLHRILLGTGAGGEDRFCGFALRRWDDLCIRLRKLTGQIHKKRGILVAAMVLAFVGAVEQNLLGFSAPGASTEGAFSRDWPMMADHIRRFLGTEDIMESSENSGERTARRDLLFSQGITLYLDSMAAMKEFERLIVKESQEVLKSSLNDLAGAAQVPLDSGSIEVYRNPNSIKDDEGWSPTYAWIAAKMKIERYTIYCGLCWDNRIPYAMVTLGFPNRGLRDAALRRLREKGCAEPRANFDKTELCFCEAIDIELAASFPNKLGNLVGKWIVALKAVDGVTGLQEVGQST